MRREYIIFVGIVVVILLLLIVPKLNKEEKININDIISEEPIEKQEELMSELLEDDRKYTEETTNIIPKSDQDVIEEPINPSIENIKDTDTAIKDTDSSTVSVEDTDTSDFNTEDIAQDGPSEEMPKEFSKTWDNVIALLCKHYVCKTLPEDYLIFLSDKGKENYSLVSPDKKLKPQFIYDYNVDRDKQLVVITTDKSEVIKFKYYLTDDLVDNIERVKK